MRIRELYIDGFGRFAGRQYGPLERPVTVFFGPNEAGKSTLLEFIRRMMYGYPDGRSRANQYPPLMGGNHGGRIAVEEGDGRRYDIRRTAGSRGGTLTISAVSGEPVDEATLSRLLGYNSRIVFEQVFAFTLEELHSSELLDDSNVNSQIYSAGMGVTSLPNAIRNIDTEKEAIFLNRGRSNQKTYVVCGEIDGIDKRLQEVADNAARYGERTDRLKQVKDELESLRVRRQEIQSRYNHQVMLQNAWDVWIDFVTASNRLRELPEINEFPRNGVSELETLEKLAATARGELEAARQRKVDTQERATLQIEFESILERSSEVRDLERRRSAFDQSVKDVPERQAELAAMRLDLKNTLADLGQDWDVERLNGFDLSIVVREDISNFNNRLGQAREDVSRVKAAVVADKDALNEAVEDLEKAKNEFDESSLPGFDRDAIREIRRQLRSARRTLNELSRSEERASDFRGQLEDELNEGSPIARRDWSRIIPSAIGGAALILLGVLFATNSDGPPTNLGISAVILGIFLIIAATYFFALGRTSKRRPNSAVAARIRRQLGEAEEHSDQLRNGLSECESALGIDSINSDSLDEAEESLNVEEMHLNELDRLQNTLYENKNRMDRRRARWEDSKQALDGAERTFETAKDQWRTWLRERGLMETFSPENIEVLRGLVDLGRTHYTKVTQMEDRIAAIHTDIEQFIDLVHSLTSAFGFKFDPQDWSGVAVTADELIDLHANVLEKERKRKDAQDELTGAKKELAGRNENLEELEQKCEELLSAAGAQSRDEFRRMADVFAERQELEAKVAGALDRLRRLSGPGGPLESLRAELEETDFQSIEADITRLEAERTDVDDQRETLSAEQGEIRNEMDGLVGEEESSRLRMERNVLLEQLRDHARDWTRLTLARNLLDEARRKFEQERQPGVVRHAQEFFTAITDGRYRQVYAPLGEQTITVTDADGRTKQPSELSRGTREQLFLSLRFGLIRELGQRTEPLPVVVDEVLVNFDPDRALRAAVAFTELSKTNQVLVFTCHPTVVDLFHNAASELSVEKPDVVQII